MNYKEISKITIYSIIMGIFALIGIIVFAGDFPNWAKYGPEFLVDPAQVSVDKLLPIEVQEARVISLISLVLSILFSALIIWEIKKMETCEYKKYFIASLGVFTWLMLPYTIFIGLRDKVYSQFFQYGSQNRINGLQISFLAVKNGLTNNGKRDKLFWNTLFGYFLFLVTIVGLIFCAILAEDLYGQRAVDPIKPEDLKPGWTIDEYYAYNKKSHIFSTILFFTQLTNFSCFLFMLGFVFFSNKICFRNNTLMIAVASYIFIVSAIFWTYLFPISLAKNEYVKDFQWVKTSWLHAVTPILFIIFSITSFNINKEAPTQFKKIIIPSLIYPLTYGMIVYPLPFMTRFSVYGGLTNLNPNMNTSVGLIEQGSNGNPLMVLGFFGLFALFIGVIFGFWSIAFSINKKANKKV